MTELGKKVRTQSPSSIQFSSVQSLSRVQLIETPWTAARQASLSINDSRNLLKLMSIESVMPSSHFILCRPSPSPPTFNLFFKISWRLITLQYCSGFCHTLKRIFHGFTFVPHPDPPSLLPLHPLPLGLPSAPGPSACLMHPTWAGDLFHPR